MRVPRPSFLVVGVALAALVLLACGGDGDAQPTATATSPPAATNTPAIQVDVPGRPNAFADYPGVVGIYLTVAGETVLGAPCLSEFVLEWAMAEPDVPLTPEERCLTGNTDVDPDDEVVVLFTAESEDGFGLLSNVVVFDSTPDGYVAVFESWTPDQFPEVFPQAIIAAEDITGDGNGDLVYTVTTCGAHTCTLAVHVVTGEDAAYRRLTPEEGIGMATADLTLEDTDGDGAQEIVLRGGTIGSVGAGPQRTRTEVYAWNGNSYELTETTYDPTDVLYFHILDADEVFAEGEYLQAATAYRAALADESLTESGYYENERAELSAYALFRVALGLIAGQGSEDDALSALERARSDYAGTVNVGLALTFEEAFGATGSLHGACLAVRDHITANADAFQETWYYGYANPEFDPEAICPF